jgi:mannose-1-phosphate guanylyltransferase/mannose-6-phosphate isomerase
MRERPWGFMRALNAPKANLTVKYLCVHNGERTSLQYHKHKDELLFIINGSGFVDVGGERYEGAGLPVRIKPGVVHRVTGPLVYLEVSSCDDGTDTIRLSDDYGR